MSDAANPEAMDDDRAFALESRLTNHGCYLQTVAVEGNAYRFTYQSAAADQHAEIPHQQIGDIVNDFRELFDQHNWPVRSLEVTVTNFDGELMGEWHADVDWFAALDSAEMTEVEFSQRVLDSLKTE